MIKLWILSINKFILLFKKTVIDKVVELKKSKEVLALFSIFFSQKLTLSKQTVSKLTEASEVKGGMTPTILVITSIYITCGSDCFCGGTGGGPTQYQTC